MMYVLCIYMYVCMYVCSMYIVCVGIHGYMNGHMCQIDVRSSPHRAYKVTKGPRESLAWMHQLRVSA